MLPRAFAAEFVRHFDSLFNLPGGIGENLGVRAGRRTMQEARIGKETGRAPEELDPRALLFLL